MNAYYLSETLKTKHLFVRKAAVYGPVMALMLIFLLSSDYLYVHLFNWWHSLIIPVTMPFLCVLLSHIDGRMKDMGVKSVVIDQQKVWLAKLCVAFKYLFLSCLILYASFVLFTLILDDDHIIGIPYTNALMAALVIFISYLWQIPFCFLLAYKAGLFITIFSSVLLNCIIGNSMAANEYWFLCPFSYAGKFSHIILNIRPNGLVDLEESTPLAVGAPAFVLILSISVTLLVISIKTTSGWYKAKEVI